MWSEHLRNVAGALASLLSVALGVLVVWWLARSGVLATILGALPGKYARRRRVEARYLRGRGPHYVPAARMNGVRMVKVRRCAWFGRGVKR